MAEPTATVEVVTKKQRDEEVKPARERRSSQAVARDVLGTAGQVAQLVFLVLALIVILGILFVVSDANLGNNIVKHLVRYAGNVVGPFRDVFTEGGKKVISSHGRPCGRGVDCGGVAGLSKKGVFANWGLAAVVYLLAGALIRRVLGK